MTNAGGDLVLLVGHPNPHSRTHGIAGQMGRLLWQALAAEQLDFPEPVVVDLAQLAPYLLDRHTLDGAADRAVQTVRRATVLVTVSPTFRGAYSGLLKFFLDILPRDGLRGSIALPLMTAGLPRHRLIVERTLRPLLVELRAQVPTAGICVLEADLARCDDVFDRWWQDQGDRLVAAIRAGSPGQLPRPVPVPGRPR